jgi:hypothetical protein
MDNTAFTIVGVVPSDARKVETIMCLSDGNGRPIKLARVDSVSINVQTVSACAK